MLSFDDRSLKEAERQARKAGKVLEGAALDLALSEVTNDWQAERLIPAAQRGDREALGQLFIILYPWTYAICRAKTRHRETAEDLAKDTWVKVLENLHTFHPDEGSFRAWLGTIAARTCIDWARRQRRVAFEPLATFYQGEEEGEPLEPPDPSALSVEQRALFWVAWHRLSEEPEDHYDLLLLRFKVGLSRQEIAQQWPQRWGGTQQSVGNHERRAKQAFMEHLRAVGFLEVEEPELMQQSPQKEGDQ